jgi:hypothetical protein
MFSLFFAEVSGENLLVTNLLLLAVRSRTNCVDAACGNDQNYLTKWNHVRDCVA